MRILMLAQFYKPTIGGEERHVQDLSTTLVARGHEVAVATLWHKGMEPFEVDEGVQIYRVKSLTQHTPWLYSASDRRHAPPFPDPSTAAALHHLVARMQPDVVHAHNWLLHSFVPLKAWSKAPLVVSLHDYSLSCAQKRLMRQGSVCSGPSFTKCLNCAANHYGKVKGSVTMVASWLSGTVERNVVDMFLPVSYATAQGNGLVDSDLPFQVIPNFVTEEVTNTRPEQVAAYLEQLPKGEFLLFVGDLSRDKGVQVLLKAYAELTDAPPLVLIGRRGLDIPLDFPDNVISLGHWPHEAVKEAWRRSLMGIVPSFWLEPFGIVAIEAMAAGKPLVASNIGGLQDIVVHDETGLLVVPGDVQALGAAIQSLITLPAKRESMGRAARERVNVLFRADVVVSQVERVYQDLLEKRSQQRPAGAVIKKKTIR